MNLAKYNQTMIGPHRNCYEKRLQGTGGVQLAIYEQFYQQRMTADAKKYTNKKTIRNGRSQV